jgi:hypothetical protein
MINRRQFIAAGAATASVAAALAGASIAADSPAGAGGAVADPLAAGPGSNDHARARGPHLVLFDERFAAARSFGASMREHGFTVQAIRGDVTDIWYVRLHPLWKRTSAPIAGVTAYAAMFCLEHLAWDHGLRMTRHEPYGGAAPSLYAWSIAAPGGRTAGSV